MAAPIIRNFLNEQSFQQAVFELLKAELQEAASQPHAVLLSGGRTPLPIYAALAQAPVAVAKSAHVSFSDERHVPVDSPESNFGAAAPMLDALQLAPHQVLRVPTEKSLEEAAHAYDATLRQFVDAGGKFTLALLGIGADGHTCSLFTEEDLARAAGHLAISVERPSPPHRISVTPELLSTVARVIFLVSGPDKEEIVQRLLKTPEQTVAGRAVAHCPSIEIWRA